MLLHDRFQLSYKATHHRPYLNHQVPVSSMKGDNSLPPGLTILKNDKAKHKAALGKCLHTHSFYSVDEFFVCKDDN